MSENKTTTLHGFIHNAQEKIFSYPSHWPRVGDILTHNKIGLHYSVKRVRSNGDTVIEHILMRVAIRVTVEKLENNYSLHQRAKRA